MSLAGQILFVPCCLWQSHWQTVRIKSDSQFSWWKKCITVLYTPSSTTTTTYNRLKHSTYLAHEIFPSGWVCVHGDVRVCVCVMCLICIYLSFISAWIVWIFHFEMVLLFIVLISAVVLGFVFNEHGETRKSTLAHKLILTSYFYFTQLFQKFTVPHPISRSHQTIWIHLCACVCVCIYKGTM